MSAASTAFAGGALARGLLGLAFAAAAFALAWLVETVPLAGEAPRAAPTAVALALDSQRIVRIDSTYAVAAKGWSVTVAGKPASAQRSDDAGWSGTVGAGEIVISAEPADAADVRAHALRATVDRREQSTWGIGAVTLVVPP
jgi:hypothetical protein